MTSRIGVSNKSQATAATLVSSEVLWYSLVQIAFGPQPRRLCLSSLGAMREQRDIIRKGLQELSNASESGRDCWVTFEANGKEHWLQCTPAQINMDWPFSSAPAESEGLRECFGSGRAVNIDAWDKDTYVTFTPTVRDVDSLIMSIDSTFQDLYGLGAEYTLTYKIEDC